MHAFSGVLAALLRRERDGSGAVVDVSMFDSLVEWMGHPMYLQMYAGQQPPRMGLAHPAIVPYDAYPTSDGRVLIGVQNNRGWVQLVEVLGLPSSPRTRTTRPTSTAAATGRRSTGWSPSRPRSGAATTCSPRW